ncbi:MAG: HlyD family efflux transporter periplasmic adaptor subunit [Fuerstiella sp.]
MSEAEGSSEENLRRVRERVMQLAREIEKMSGEDVPPTTFFQEFLNRVVMAIGAKAGAVWLVSEGRLNLAAEANLEQTGLRERPGAMQTNEKLLVDVLQTGEAKTIAHGQGVELPTEHVMVLSALHKEKECVGVVQLFQRTDVPEKARSGYMQFLEQMCGYASRYIEGKRRNASMSDDLKSQFWTDFEQYLLRVQRSLDEQEVADAAASDGRSLLNCDRLSVVTKKGSAVKVRAVSGQSTVNARANLVVAMSKLCRRVIDSGETLIYAGRIENLPPQIEKPLANFVQESGSRMIMIVPLFQSDELVREQGEDAERKRRTKRPKAIGCIVVEQVAESEPAPQLEERAELLADHIGAALWNARTHGRILGRSFFKLIGSGLEWFHGKKLAITAAVLLVLAGVVAAMTLIRLPYPVEAQGKLMPVEQHAVFAPWDGKLQECLLSPSNGVYRVVKGEEIFRVVNEELEDEIRKAQAEFDKQAEILRQLELTFAGLPQDNAEERRRILVEIIAARGEKEIAADQRDRLVARRNELLVIRAPADGVIPDFQRMEILENRPVRAGDHLFDVMNDAEETELWHLELLVEEKRMGHIKRARQTRAEQLNKPIDEVSLDGDFTMASLPASKFDCHLERIATRSTTDPELGTAFEVIAKADEELPERRIGLEVTARFECNDVTLAYYCFGDIVEFVQRELWWF